MNALSRARLGVQLGLVDGLDPEAISWLMLRIQNAHLELMHPDAVDPAAPERGAGRPGARRSRVVRTGDGGCRRASARGWHPGVTIATVWPPRRATTGLAPVRSPVAPRRVGLRADFATSRTADRAGLEGGPVAGRWSAIERRLLGASGSLVRDGWLRARVVGSAPGARGRSAWVRSTAGCASCRGRRLRWDRAVRSAGIGACCGRDHGVQVPRDRASGAGSPSCSGRGQSIARCGGLGSPVRCRRWFRSRRRCGVGSRTAGSIMPCVLARGSPMPLGSAVPGGCAVAAGSQAAAGTAAAAGPECARRVRCPKRASASPIPGLVVVLVDDVRTTGATAAACFGVLGVGHCAARTPGAGSVRPFVLATAAVSNRRGGGVCGLQAVLGGAKTGVAVKIVQKFVARELDGNSAARYLSPAAQRGVFRLRATGNSRKHPLAELSGSGVMPVSGAPWQVNSWVHRENVRRHHRYTAGTLPGVGCFR
jgi:hypothetical protein